VDPDDAIAAAAKASPLQAEYGQTIDRESAYERLNAKVAPPSESTDTLPPPVDGGLASASGQVAMPMPAEPQGPGVVSEVLQSSAFKSFIRSAATVAGREITRSIFGTGTRRRR
jgi:uncharacterized protein